MKYLLFTLILLSCGSRAPKPSHRTHVDTIFLNDGSIDMGNKWHCDTVMVYPTTDTLIAPKDSSWMEYASISDSIAGIKTRIVKIFNVDTFPVRYDIYLVNYGTIAYRESNGKWTINGDPNKTVEQLYQLLMLEKVKKPLKNKSKSRWRDHGVYLPPDLRVTTGTAQMDDSLLKYLPINPSYPYYGMTDSGFIRDHRIQKDTAKKLTRQ